LRDVREITRAPSSVSYIAKLASDMVGDGKGPNLYFVTDVSTGETFALCAEYESAVTLAKSVEHATVEDRSQGVVWSTEHGEER
jgi:hypothetical protein